MTTGLGNLGRQHLATFLQNVEPVMDKKALGLAHWGLQQAIDNFGEDDPITTGLEAKVEQLQGKGDHPQ